MKFVVVPQRDGQNVDIIPTPDLPETKNFFFIDTEEKGHLRNGKLVIDKVIGTLNLKKGDSLHKIGTRTAKTMEEVVEKLRVLMVRSCLKIQ